MVAPGGIPRLVQRMPTVWFPPLYSTICSVVLLRYMDPVANSSASSVEVETRLSTVLAAALDPRLSAAAPIVRARRAARPPVRWLNVGYAGACSPRLGASPQLR